LEASPKVLSIQINLNGLSFCIQDKAAKSVDHLHEVKFEKSLTPHEILPRIKDELSSKAIFSQDFKEVHVIHQNELATLVPNELFDEDHIADYLKYNSKILKSDYISFDDLDSINVKNVYVPYVNINNYLFDTFGQFIYKHSLTVFLEALLKAKPKHSEGYCLYVNLNPTTFEIIVLSGEQVVLTNVHQYFSKEDLLYFVLFTIEQLGLDPEVDPLVLSGEIEPNDAVYELLYTYIRHLKFNDTTSELAIIKTADHFVSRHYLILNSF